MKVKKAIKRIAALGVGASFVGATLMGAMAADLSEYPNMFIQNGQFNGLLVVGKNAAAIDTIGVTNIALGLQKAAVTETTVCGQGTTSRTQVEGEKVKISKTGEDLNVGEELADVQDTPLDEGDLPSILAEGEFDESEGETDNDVTYDQEITLEATQNDIIFDQDDDDAPEAGVYLKMAKNVDVYTYTLEFNDDVEYDVDEPEADFEGAVLEMQGLPYTITDVELDGSGDIDKVTMLVGQSVMWMAEGEVVTKEVGGVEHTIKMIDVANNVESCGFEVDGSRVWIDDQDTETISGVTIGVTEAREVNVEAADADICKVFIGAEEMVLEANKEIDVGGDEVDGSLVTFTSNNGTWTQIDISYDPEKDVYLAEGDEWVDPVFGNFKFIMGGLIADSEELKPTTSSNTGTLTFMNYDDDEVEIPFVMDEGTGTVYLGDDETDVADQLYLESQICNGAGDLQNCVGAQFLVITSGDVAHVVEIAAIDETDNKVDFDDVTAGTSTDNKAYTDNVSTPISLGSGLGSVSLTLDETGGRVVFGAIDDGGLKTSNEGIIVLNAAADEGNLTLTENDEEGVEDTIIITLGAGTGSDDDKLEINTVAGATYGPEDFSDDNNDVAVYMTPWGSRIEYDTEDENDLTIMHPEEQAVVDVWVAETEAATSVSQGTTGDCTVSQKVNPIPATVNKFDNEVTTVAAQNLIAVGGPCANTVSAQLMGNPEECYAGFEEGKATLKLVQNGANVALIVAGGTGRDTQLASRILQQYEDYDLAGMEMVATTVSESGLKVEKVQ